MVLLCFVARSAIADDPSPPAKAKKPLPADFPAFSNQPGIPGNGNWGAGPFDVDSEFVCLMYSNRELIKRLNDYTSESIVAEFERRMEAEQDIQLKLVFATIAAGSGGEKGHQFVHDAAENLDGVFTYSRMSALEYLICSPHPAEWVFDEIYAALNDTRKVTMPHDDRAQPSGDTAVFSPPDEPREVCSLTDLLALRLGQVPNPRSVAVLMKLTNRNGYAIEALGLLRDPVAIPLCLEYLRNEDASIKEHKFDEDHPADSLVEALGRLKAKEAVPILLKYLHSKAVIAALGEIGDARAIEPLKNIEANKEEAKDKDLVFAARMALIKIEKGDPYPKWFAVLNDKSLEWSQRREAVWELGNHPDASAIPQLIKAIKSDPAGEVVNQCITVLSVYKFKAAVRGLIGCFNADFKGKSDWKRAYEPQMFAENIGESLKQITGQDFGADKAQWIKWWSDEGKNASGLK